MQDSTSTYQLPFIRAALPAISFPKLGGALLLVIPASIL
jgi:hypothetical protein